MGADLIREQLRMLEPRRLIVVVSAHDLRLTLERLDAFEIAAKVSGDPVVNSATDPGRDEQRAERVSMPFRLRPEVAAAIRKFCADRGRSLNRVANELLAAALGVPS